MGQFQITSARGKQTRGRRRVDWGEEWEWAENNIAAPPYLFIQNYALQSSNVPWTEYQVLILPSHTYKLRYSGVRLIKIVLHSNGCRYSKYGTTTDGGGTKRGSVRPNTT